LSLSLSLLLLFLLFDVALHFVVVIVDATAAVVVFVVGRCCYYLSGFLWLVRTTAPQPTTISS